MLAIIIPYYKHTFFEATLQSLAAQTCQDFKVYIGDDASPENPTDLLEHFQDQFNFVYHRFESNLGGVSLTQQWERCIALSDAEPWLMILGDDDVLGEHVVEAFYENLPEIEGIGCTVVRFATQKVDELGNKISRVFEHPKLENSVDFLFRKTRSSLSEYIFNKKKVKKIGFKDFPLGWGSDKLAVFEFSIYSRIFTINDSNVYIRISKISISGSKSHIELKNQAVFYYHQYFAVNYFNLFSNIQKKIFIEEWKKSCLILSENEIEVVNLFFRNNYMIQHLINMKIRVFKLNYLTKRK
jgi:glycosyltransferase involved in cell wall biosynthesis